MITAKQTVSEKNEALKAELWARGLYVQEVGELGRIDYLIVSCLTPTPQAPPNGEPFEYPIVVEDGYIHIEEPPKPIYRNFANVILDGVDEQGENITRTDVGKTPIFPIEIRLNVHIKELAECETIADAKTLIGDSYKDYNDCFPLTWLKFNLIYPLKQSIHVEIEFCGCIADILYPIAKIYKDTIYASETNEFGVFGHGIEDLVFESLILQGSGSSLYSEVWIGS